MTSVSSLSVIHAGFKAWQELPCSGQRASVWMMKKLGGSEWWLMPRTPVLRTRRQENCCDVMSLNLAWAT